MSISVLVNGAAGRMGQMTVQAIAAHPNLDLAGVANRHDDLYAAIKQTGAKVVVDFTHPQVVYKNVEIILETDAHPVIGTTGITREQITTLQQKAEMLKRGGIIAPNFSLAAVLMMKYAKEIKKYMPQVEIIELHHDGKVDSPSGTALRTAELMAEVDAPLTEKKSSTEIVRGARGANYLGIPIHSVRLSGLLAHQQILFGALGETLTLRLDSIDRKCYMQGVCMACEKVLHLSHLIYGLEELL